MIDSRCGLHCTGCGWKDSHGCGGCIETMGNPFHGECPVAVCCQNKKHVHCGECAEIPCALLTEYSCHPEQGDTPHGARIEQCRQWAKGTEPVGCTTEERRGKCENKTEPSACAEKLQYTQIPEESALTLCGIDCARQCPEFNKKCGGCDKAEGRVFYFNGEGICPIYDCAVNKLRLNHCGECGKLPCAVYYDFKDPDISDEQHLEGVKNRAAALKNRK